jgi:O-acetyl-ADP-ribose deacetylase (regulator of RNase III)
MKIVTGNLIQMAKDSKFDVIVHGCNCFNTMGGGIARVIRETWPIVYEADCKTIRGDKKKLGTIDPVLLNNNVYVVNAYTQYYYGRGLQVSYDAIRSCFSEIKNAFNDLKIGYPLIGAGLAGGDWNIISKIINEELEGCDHTLVKLP